MSLEFRPWDPEVPKKDFREWEICLEAQPEQKEDSVVKGRAFLCSPARPRHCAPTWLPTFVGEAEGVEVAEEASQWFIKAQAL